ncbi:acyl-CoA thioesterase [Gordonia sp. KTR9]|uniref:acyl-CoA thioesterase n=1 Tax=Gordonia sp. KTR9 TaxID=337191 RepID=UPI00027DDF4F|nr:acyl-CoA thioesterase domain-containing protein [Gordonia sp. KTR9]AFR49495.1 Acyl-CoA thioesterase [Gordonia sp. KTR9]
MTGDTESVISLDDILTLRRTGVDRYAGSPAPDGGGRLYGGHAIAQAVIAASETVSGSVLRSLQIDFLRPGKEERGVDYAVQRLLTGRRLASRRVEGHQGGKLLFTATALFAGQEIAGAVDLPEGKKMTDMPPIPTRRAVEQHEVRGVDVPGAAIPRYERTGMRFVDDPPRVAAHTGCVPRRSRGYCDLRELDPERAIAGLGYASDLSMLDPVAYSTGLIWRESAVPATLTHTMTVHRPDLVGSILLFDRELAGATDGIVTVVAGVYATSGHRAATLTQSALLLEP